MRSSIVLTFLSLPVLKGRTSGSFCPSSISSLCGDFSEVSCACVSLLCCIFCVRMYVCWACYYIKFRPDSDSNSDSDSDSATICNSPSSYRQPSGNGQLLSRRYCTHSVWFFSRRQNRHIVPRVSVRKYFKQSKGQTGCTQTRHVLYWSYLRSTRYSSTWRWLFEPPSGS